MRVRFTESGTTGTAIGHAQTFLLQEGPWVHVKWDDGFVCWCLESSLEGIQDRRQAARDGDVLYRQSAAR